MPFGQGRSGGGGGRGRGGDKKTGRQGKGPAPHAVPPPQGLQVLRGQDRRHQLQGREADRAVRARARQDSAAAHLRHLRDAPAQAADGDQARAPDRAHSVRHGLRSDCSQIDEVRSLQSEDHGSHSERTRRQPRPPRRGREGRRRLRAQLPAAAQAGAAGDRRQQEADRARAREVRRARKPRSRRSPRRWPRGWPSVEIADRAQGRRDRGAVRVGDDRRHRRGAGRQGLRASIGASCSCPSRSRSSASSTCRSSCTAT